MIKRVVIAGGGTAGWMTAAAISKLLSGTIDVTLIESDTVPTVGVGEATIPTLHILHRLLGIDEADFMANTNATFKLGISFENWRKLNHQYIHSFGLIGHETWACGFHHFWLKARSLGLCNDELGDYIPEHLAAREGRFSVTHQQRESYAYHLDAGLYATYLRKIAENNQVKRIEGLITDVNRHTDSGYIASVQLASGQVVDGDLFIDCSGFRGLLIEQSLHTGFESWQHQLLCDRAVAVQTESIRPPVPYTRSIAHKSGWQWQIPLQNRTGNGLVFSSHYLSEDQAIDTLLQSVSGQLINEPRVIRYQTGIRHAQWNKNCIAVGLSGGFIEPLESTGIHLFQRAIIRLLQFFPKAGIHQCDIDEFNAISKTEMEHIKDFIVLHYHLTERTDSEFWRHCKNMPIPDSLQHRLQTFGLSGRVKIQDELFTEASWVQVMMGQGLEPAGFHPVVDRLTKKDLKEFVSHVKAQTRQKVNSWPSHHDYIQQYCKAR